MTQPLPAWAGDGKRFVPTHLNSGTTRSSFETGEEMPSSFRRTSVSGSIFSAQGSSFGAPKTLRKPADADLPPSESIHINRTKDLSEISFKTESKPAVTPSRDTAAHQDTAVLVFGFPAGMTMAVIQHFSQFGTIIENSSNVVSASPNTSTPPAIECGRNWLRLRYKDRQAAERAVGENGRMLPGEFVVGAVLADGGDGVPAPSAYNSLLVDESDTSILADVSSILDKSITGKLPEPQPVVEPSPPSSAPSVSDPAKLVIKAPATSLFKHKEKHGVTLPHLSIHAPESLEKEIGWLSWGAKKLREAVFGWDDL
ncbi:Nucleoporin nup40 [Wickerhamiella sorbophila]|uniref:Nucleoporin nup40 n=1 Tax=Wickerhamiella sorbophila TaxID=45607 RepID=A0A2T0FCU3_9ASCO|nr:Nucleoporin nup40 [Wickerhamiella sorbophila]PRT52816.1 Nucleoporin nup40 [Wickerhamiella sorbophila]